MKATTARLGISIDAIEKVIAWASARNLILGASALSQSLKLGSEFGEIGLAIHDHDVEEIIDGIGDSLVVSIIVSEQIGRPLTGSIAGLTYAEADYATSSDHPFLLASSFLGKAQDHVLKSNFPEAARNLGLFACALWRLAATEVGRTLDSCLGEAYEVIKDRKGVMFNGAFIKESDPQYAYAVTQIEEKRLADAEALTQFAAL